MTLCCGSEEKWPSCLSQMKVKHNFMSVVGMPLTMTSCVFQSIEREEPIEVDPAPTHSGQENGHALSKGNHTAMVSHPRSAACPRS